MTLSLQKFMLVLLFKILFVSSATSKLRLPILKENNSPKNQSKSENVDKISHISHFEKKSQAKSPPVNKFF
jgi:hypothetical protein